MRWWWIRVRDLPNSSGWPGVSIFVCLGPAISRRALLRVCSRQGGNPADGDDPPAGLHGCNSHFELSSFQPSSYFTGAPC
jgi:hypothetical protein